MKGYIRFVLTEDSCYYLGPNGDPWHNQVARDYLPDTSGTYAQLAPQESVTVFRDFLVQSGWNEDRCQIVYWYQNDSLRADSSKPVYQAGKKKIMDMIVAVSEIDSDNISQSFSCSPNPCHDAATFQFRLPVNTDYEIYIYDISGRCMYGIKGVSSADITTINWDLYDKACKKVNPGVYFYNLQSDIFSYKGKIVVH